MRLQPASGHQAMPLAVEGEGVSIKISANLMTRQEPCLGSAPSLPVSLAGVRLPSEVAQTPVSEHGKVRPEPWSGDHEGSFRPSKVLEFSVDSEEATTQGTGRPGRSLGPRLGGRPEAGVCRRGAPDGGCWTRAWLLRQFK